MDVVGLRSLKYKLVLFILPLCLLPLVGVSVFSYFQAKERITEDRIVLYLEQIARDIVDTIRLTLLEKKEETIAMSFYGEFRNFLLGQSSPPPGLLLDRLIVVHEVYDLLVLFDVEGRIVLTNQIDRNHVEEERALEVRLLETLRGQSLVDFTPDSEWLRQVRSGRFAYLAWHRSPLVELLYGYEDQDVARQYNIGFAAPVSDEEGIVAGGILALMNWEYIQEILDKVEEDLEQRSLMSGYAFLFGNDTNTVIGHKYRLNRNYLEEIADVGGPRNNYGTRLVEDHNLAELREAVLAGATYYRYQYPVGTAKMIGVAPVDHEFFHWTCGVGINDEDIFAPVQELKQVLVWATVLLGLLVIGFTYSVARQMTVPLNRLTRGARVIAAGDFSQRVEIRGRDEIGELARTFNEMAGSLEERSRDLLELNRQLEEKVRERTRELERTNSEVQKAYQELQETQVQLVQSEKMASLGQLVAGIGHEIKNPLNFIYGNTSFLQKYVDNLKQLVSFYEQHAPLAGEGAERLGSLKESMNYSFMLEDLDTLIRNFEEGAERIHSIIADLKTFSRMDSEEFQRVDIREPMELALNLLRNQCRDRIQIHKEYATLPEVKCQPGRMSQVFMNLLSNACQAIPQSGDIWIRTLSENGRLVIEIEDNGPGIDQKHLAKIFEPFFTTKPVGEGTGLGLSISYGIIQQHRGNIEVKSAHGGGTCFRVLIPLEA